MKILLLTETLAGTGHYKAAESLAKGILSIRPQAQIKIDTALSHANPLLEKVASKLYMGTIRHASPLWGWAYRKDRHWGFLGKDLLRRYLSNRLESFIEEEQPDLIVSTHAFCLGGLAELKNKRQNSFRLVAALTDYCINTFWVHPEVDDYFVGAMPLKDKLMTVYGIPEEKIHVTGIPIDPMFSERRDKEWVRGKLSIPSSFLHILVMGGGLGLAPFVEILEGLSRVKAEMIVTVITGRNQQAKVELEGWTRQAMLPFPLIILDYVNNMNEWMEAADVLIGKPGGLTVSEALACEVPMLIYKPIPGQEERNSEFLLSCGIAFRADGVEELTETVQKISEDIEWKRRLRERAKEFSKPQAAYHAGKILVDSLE